MQSFLYPLSRELLVKMIKIDGIAFPPLLAGWLTKVEKECSGEWMGGLDQTLVEKKHEGIIHSHRRKSWIKL